MRFNLKNKDMYFCNFVTRLSSLYFRHEIDAHSLHIDPGPKERDNFSYFKCRAKFGYVFSTKATTNRYFFVIFLK